MVVGLLVALLVAILGALGPAESVRSLQNGPAFRLAASQVAAHRRTVGTQRPSPSSTTEWERIRVPTENPWFVHQTWKTKDIGVQELRWRNTWRTLGFRLTLADDDDCLRDMARLSKVQNDGRFLQVYKNLDTPVQRTDMWRYAKLFLDGGIYTDIDVVASPKLVTFLQRHKDKALIAFVETGNDFVAVLDWYLGTTSMVRHPQYRNSVMVAQPRHPAMKATLDSIVNNFLSGKFDGLPMMQRTLELTGPGVFTDAVNLYKDLNTTLITPVGAAKRLFSHIAIGTWKKGVNTAPAMRAWSILYYYMFTMCGLCVMAARFLRCCGHRGVCPCPGGMGHAGPPLPQHPHFPV